jgi:two-component system chemotaxis response regulator CheY
MHCLVIDDSDVIRKVAERILSKLEFAVALADSGRAALVACEERMPDMILVDWHMPGMSGVDFIAALRVLPGGQNPRVIYCTTENDAVVVTRAVQMGADTCMMKPFTRQSLVEKLAEVGLLSAHLAPAGLNGGQRSPAHA